MRNMGRSWAVLARGDAGRDAGVPGNPIWHLAPREMGWERKTLGEICAQIKEPSRSRQRTLSRL
jgi:hypothetical protein